MTAPYAALIAFAVIVGGVLLNMALNWRQSPN